MSSLVNANTGSIILWLEFNVLLNCMMTNCQDNIGKHGRGEIILCDKSSSVFGRIVTIIIFKLNKNDLVCIVT